MSEKRIILNSKASNLSAIENDKIELTRHYAEILGATLGIHPSSLLFPEGSNYKTKELKAIERKAQLLREKKKKKSA